MNPDDLKTINRDWIDAFNERDWTRDASFRSANYRAHMSATPVELGFDSWLGFLQGFADAFPDCKISVEDEVAQGDTVASRWTMTGTHQGDFLGVPATGKPMIITGIDFTRVVDGKIAEHWAQFDAASLMVQIGALPAPAAG